jgi:uroporphyrinogen-III decarboxylase
MNSSERFKTALRGGKPDRIPVAPKIWVDFAAKVANISICDILQNPVTALRVIALAGKKLGIDAVRQFHFPARRILQENGSVYEIDKNDEKIGKIDINGGLSTQLFDSKQFNISDPVTIAYHFWDTAEPVVNNLKDANSIAVPDAKVFDYLGWNKNQQTVIDEFGKHLAIIGDCGSATMSYYIRFRGIENALFDLIENPLLVHTVMEKGAQTAIAKGKYWLDMGIDILRLNDSAGNMTLMSPAHWRQFIFPYLKIVCDELHNYNKKALIYCHICGNILPIAEHLAEAGFDCIAPLDPLGGFTVRDIRDKVGNKVSLMGGVNTLSLLHNTPEQITQEAIECINGAGKNGFILGSGCVVPRDCPIENIEALVETAKKYKLN